jgi:hypothetical protein
MANKLFRDHSLPRSTVVIEAGERYTVHDQKASYELELVSALHHRDSQEAHEEVTVRYRYPESSWETATLAVGPMTVRQRDINPGNPNSVLAGRATGHIPENAKITTGSDSLPFLDGAVAWSYKSPTQMLLYVPTGIEVEEKRGEIEGPAGESE